MVYPYRVRVTDPIIENFFKRLAKDRAVPVNGIQIPTTIGRKIKPIRKDIFIGTDNTDKKNGNLIAIRKSELKINIKPAYGKRKGSDIIFTLK